MKALLLDIDGVLNSSTGIHTKVPNHGVMGVEEILKTRFKRLLTEADFKIALCSTWRLHDDLVRYLHQELGGGELYIGKTGVWPWWQKIPCPYHDERQWEVEKWIDEHPETSKWVCLDDLVYPVNRPNGIVVNTDNRFGLTDENVDQIVQFFN